MSRGYRNNNPLNIRKNSTEWEGLSAKQSDYSFFQFKTMAYGYRAAFITLNTYREKYGCVSLADYIRRWAPPCENDTNSYINFVAKRAGLADVSAIDTTNKEQMVKIVAAMARMENTAEPDMEPILQGWDLFTKDRLI